MNMRMGVRRFDWLGLGAITLAALFAGAPTAAAAEGAPARATQGWNCPDDARGCLWDGYGGTGDVYVIRDCGSMVLPPEWRDRASSYQIIRAHELAVFDYVNGQLEFMQSLYGNGQPPGQGTDLTGVPDHDNMADGIEVTC
jgi:hypothetical protein